MLSPTDRRPGTWCRGPRRAAWILAALGSVAIVTSACSANPNPRPSTAAAPKQHSSQVTLTRQPSPAATTTAAPSAAATASPSAAATASPAAPAITVQLVGLPKTLTIGAPWVEFTAVFSNHSVVAYRDVAPLFHIGAGPCNCAQGSLQRFDTATHEWRSAPMAEGDGDPNFLTLATGGVDLRPGARVTVRYRLRLLAHNFVGSAYAVLYAVQLPQGKSLAMTNAPIRIATS